MIAMIVKMMIGRPRPRLRPAAIPAVFPPLLSSVPPSPLGVLVVTTGDKLGDTLVVDGKLEVMKDTKVVDVELELVTDTGVTLLLLLLLLLLLMMIIVVTVLLTVITELELLGIAVVEFSLSVVGHVHVVTVGLMGIDVLSFIRLLLTFIIMPLPDSPDPLSMVTFVTLLFGHTEHTAIFVLSAADVMITFSEHVRNSSISNPQNVFIVNIA